MSFGAITLYEFDEPRTPLALPIESYVLATRAQPGVGFAALRRLAIRDVLRARFAVWTPPSASLVEC